MLRAIEGVYRDGKIELLERPPQTDESRVIVTFLDKEDKEWPIDMRARGIDQAEAADLRSRLSCFIEDWSRPDMDVYDEP